MNKLKPREISALTEQQAKDKIYELYQLIDQLIEETKAANDVLDGLTSHVRRHRGEYQYMNLQEDL